MMTQAQAIEWMDAAERHPLGQDLLAEHGAEIRAALESPGALRRAMACGTVARLARLAKERRAEAERALDADCAALSHWIANGGLRRFAGDGRTRRQPPGGKSKDTDHAHSSPSAPHP